MEGEPIVATFINVWRKLSDRKYRSSFAIAQFKRLVPFQIRALRKSRNWSQAELAEHSGLTQGVISRAEDSDNGNLAVNTILKIADGFDVAFVGRFVPYSELDEWFTEISEEKLRIPSFEEEDKLLKMRAVPFTRSESCDRPEHSEKEASSTAIKMPASNLAASENSRDGKKQQLTFAPPRRAEAAQFTFERQNSAGGR